MLNYYILHFNESAVCFLWFYIVHINHSINWFCIVLFHIETNERSCVSTNISSQISSLFSAFLPFI